MAVSTACGSLNNMVVDTVEQGQACIEYLRAQNIGRASFMVLDKLTNTRGMEPIQTPEGVPRLFDLIKPKDPRFAAAFYKGGWKYLGGKRHGSSDAYCVWPAPLARRHARRSPN